MSALFPVAFISEAALPDVIASLRNAEIEVDELETCKYDRGIGVQLLLRCIIDIGHWAITIQAAPPTAPYDLIIVLRAEGDEHTKPKSVGAEAIWTALRSGGIHLEMESYSSQARR